MFKIFRVVSDSKENIGKRKSLLSTVTALSYLQYVVPTYSLRNLPTTAVIGADILLMYLLAKNAVCLTFF